MEEKRRRIIIACIVGFVVILLISITGVFVYYNSIDSAGDNDGPSNEIYENSAVFENRPIINAAIGSPATSVILDNVANFIFSEVEMATAKHENTANYEMPNYYNVKINNDLLSYNSNYIYKVSIEVSDGRRYELSFRTDDKYGYENYIMMAMKNLDTGRGAIYLNINDGDAQSLVDWMRTFSGLKDDAEVILGRDHLVEEN